MASILETIVARKQVELTERRRQTPQAVLAGRVPALPPPRGFRQRLDAAAVDRPAIIAEIKRGSPSLGCLRPQLNASAQAGHYAAGGAACLSVLTDEQFFFGHDRDLVAAREACPLPALRKDFVVDEYQLYESRVLGADCILLIMACLTPGQARALAETAHRLHLDVLCEVHDESELQAALDHVPYDLLGINSRNLKTFSTSTELTLALAERVPDRSRLVAESGLKAPGDLRALWDAGIRRYLIGEAFVRGSDPRATVAAFVNFRESAP